MNSPSHDDEHLARATKYALQLADIYGGNKKLLRLAVKYHDLARGDHRHRGKQSAVEGARLASSFLKQQKLSKSEIETIKQIIAEHDDPKFHSSLLESKILKDADFLDGFGARGIWRSVMYAGETGGGAKEALDRLCGKMRQRLEGLEFEESRRMAWQQYRLVEYFLQQLKHVDDLDFYHYSGKLIVLEGISGAGKDTQMKLLAKKLKEQGKKVLVVNHPTAWLKIIWKKWRQQTDDSLSEALLMMADRARVVRNQILPALKKGDWVISSRSGVSAQVYQNNIDFGAEFYRLIFTFEPVADLLLYLYTPAAVAQQRAGGGFFSQKQTKQQNLYSEILKHYPSVVKIKAAGSITSVAEAVWQKVSLL